MSEIDDSLNAFLADEAGNPPELVKLLSLAYLRGYSDGLMRGSELAERSWNTALEAMREHYPEITNNALRNYLSHPDRSAAQDDPRGERDR